MLRQLTLWVSAMLIVACGSHASSDGTDKLSPVSDPSVAEARLFEHVISQPDIKVGRKCIDPVTAPPERPQNWADTLFFGDGKVASQGDPRYDEVTKRYVLAAPIRPHRLRLPGTAERDMNDMPPCDWRLTFYPPYFDRDMAFVVVNERDAREEVPGGEFRLWIFRKRDNSWRGIGYGQGTYGRPVI